MEKMMEMMMEKMVEKMVDGRKRVSAEGRCTGVQLPSVYVGGKVKKNLGKAAWNNKLGRLA
jgi:hypothetical protein